LLGRISGSGLGLGGNLLGVALFLRGGGGGGLS